MLKKFGTLFTTLCVVNLLMIAGLVGFLWGTGRLDGQKAQTISDMLKHQGGPENLREKVYEIMAPPATGPATATAPASNPVLAVEPGAAPATAEDRIDYVKRLLEEGQIRLESAAQNVRHEQELLRQAQAAFEIRKQAFEAEKKTFESQQKAVTTTKDDAGFTRMVALMDELKPKQIKDLLMGMKDEEAVKYMEAMASDRLAKVIPEFKGDVEQASLKRFMTRLRGGEAAAGTSAAEGKTELATSAGGAVATPGVPVNGK